MTRPEEPANVLAYPRLLQAILEAEDSGALFRAELALVVFLLRRNYELGPDDLAELLDDRGDKALGQILRDALRTVAETHLAVLGRSIDLRPPGTGEALSPSNDDPRTRSIWPPLSLLRQALGHVFGGGSNPDIPPEDRDGISDVNGLPSPSPAWTRFRGD